MDMLIYLHQRLLKYNFQHNIYLYGEGIDKKKIEEIIKKENLQNTFKIIQEYENPNSYIVESQFIWLLDTKGKMLNPDKITLRQVMFYDKNILITSDLINELNIYLQGNKEKIIILKDNEQSIYEEVANLITKEKNSIEQEKIYQEIRESRQEILNYERFFTKKKQYISNDKLLENEKILNKLEMLFNGEK